MSSTPLKVRCTQMTKAGRPCRRWAVRGSDPPTCSSHLRAVSEGDALKQAPSTGPSTCSGGTSGCLLRSPSESEGVCPRSSGGVGAGEEGFYSPMLSADELADLVDHVAELTLADEIACTRAAVRRTLEFLGQGRGSVSESDYLRAAGLVFQGARTMARLLRDQQALLGDSTDRLTAIFDAALDELSEEWGIEL